MLAFLTISHFLFSILLIALVLLQDPKGGTAGGIFGGGSNSLLGATGATSFLAKLTRATAVGFGLLCLAMTWYLKRDTGSVLDAVNAPAAAAAPAAPADSAAPPADPAPGGEIAPPAAGAAESTPSTTPATTASPGPAAPAKE